MNFKEIFGRFTVLPIHSTLSITSDVLEVVLNEHSEQLEYAFQMLEQESISEISFEMPDDEGIVILLLIEGKVDIQFEKNNEFLFSTMFQTVLEEAFDDLVQEQCIQIELDRKYGKHTLSLANIDEIDGMIQSIF